MRKNLNLSSYILLLILIGFSFNSYAQKEYIENIKHKYFVGYNHFEALKEYGKAVRLFPNYAEAHYLHGMENFFIKEFNNAIEDFNNAIKLDTLNTMYILYRAESYKEIEDYNRALSDLSRAIKKEDPTQLFIIALCLERGKVKSIIKDYTGAVQDYNVCIDKGYSEAYYNRGLAKSNLYDFRGAIADLTKSIEYIPEKDWVHYERGYAKSRLEDYRGAINDYDIELKLNPSDKDVYYHRGMAKLLLKQTNGGCLDLSKAGELGHEGAYEAIKKFCNDISIEPKNIDLPIINNMSEKEYLGLGLDHWIDENHDGEIIKLEDGSVWEVLDYDVYNSMLWLPVDDVVVIFNEKEHGEFCYRMKNKDEVVKVKLLNQ